MNTRFDINELMTPYIDLPLNTLFRLCEKTDKEYCYILSELFMKISDTHCYNLLNDKYYKISDNTNLVMIEPSKKYPIV